MAASVLNNPAQRAKLANTVFNMVHPEKGEKGDDYAELRKATQPRGRPPPPPRSNSRGEVVNRKAPARSRSRAVVVR